MARQVVDRGLPLEGIQTAVRDSRVPYVYPRALQNVSLRDKRIRRRGGMERYSDELIPAQQLTKHTSNSLHSIADYEGRAQHYKFLRAPLSYGLLRWNEHFQPRKTKGTAIEFVLTLGDREELVTNPYTRTSRETYGASQETIRGPYGVYVYDQAVLANHFTLDSGGTPYSVEPYGAGTYADVFSLTTIAVAYNETHITVLFDLWNSSSSSYECDNKIQFQLGEYVPGRSYQIVVAFEPSFSGIMLWVNGNLQDSFQLTADQHWCGEYDAVNGTTTALKRDIVLLNEFTARAGYASTCVPIKNVSTSANDHGYQTFHSYEQDDDRREPWACSPPAGTGLQELRFWNFSAVEELSAIVGGPQFSRYEPIEGLDTEPVALFHMDSGIGYIRDQIDSNRAITVHHTNAALIDEGSFINGKGLNFADGQYLIQQHSPTAGYDYISPVQAALEKMFGHGAEYLSSASEFTVEIQIKTPDTFGQEINRVSGAISLAGTKSDTRDGIEFAKSYGLTDGVAVPNYVRDEDGTAVTTNQMRWHRAFDSTLWSIEGTKASDDTAENNYGELYRCILSRGLLTPEGYVAFEFFGFISTGAGVGHTREFRVISATPLDTSTTHTLSFRRRMIYAYDSTGTSSHRIYGYALEILIDGTLSASLTITDGTTGEPTSDISATGLTSNTSECAGVSDVIIGASCVNHAFDANNTEPNADSATIEAWPVSQRFMSSRQDQVGFFSMGFFRLWHRALADEELLAFANSPLSSKDTSSLVYRLEVDNPTGDEFFDQGPFSTKWVSRYKGWGYPQLDTEIFGNFTGLQIGWFMEDCLGYAPSGNPDTEDRGVFRNNGNTLPCTGLAFYSPTLSSTFGLLSTFKGFARFDKDATGHFDNLRSPSYGLLSNYSTSGRWQGLNIGDRTVLTSPSGYPKIFNGSHILPLGFRNYNGGSLHLANLGTGSLGNLTADSYYGVRLFYFSERHNIYHVSPQYTVRIASGAVDNAITIRNIPQHPDTRVTSIIVGVTLSQVTEDLARNAPVYAVEGGYLPNKMTETYVITESDGGTFTLDTSYTKAPQGTTAASYNGRLYIAGDPNIPDIIYFGDPGNPEAWDTLTNRIILEEGSGDRIVSLKAMFGSLYAFKANSIWRIDEVALGQHQLTKIAAIGPASEYAIETITIPDTGRTAILFWGAHGPYLFDEVNLQYLGFAVEHEREGFGYVRHDTVFTVHDVANRQVLFFYQQPEATDRYIGALVYNYRHNVWTTDTGRPGYVGLSVDLTKRAFGGAVDGDRYTLDYLGLVGADNGAIYKLSNDTELDGYEHDEQYVFDITGFSTANNTLSVDWGILLPAEQDSLNGLWLTVVSRSRKEWFQIPIIRNQGTDIQLDADAVTMSFQPQAGDSVHIGFAPLLVEFPWDVLDIPYYDKQVHRITFWATAPFSYAMQHGWGSNSLSWLDVSASGGKRVHVDPTVPTSEAFKLYIQTLEPDFRFDGFVYVIELTRDAVFHQ